MYFSKTFNAKHELTMNLVGTYYKSDYNYQYSELSDGVTDFETATDIISASIRLLEKPYITTI